MRNVIIILSLFLCVLPQLQAQEDGVVSYSIPVRNSLKFNRHLINPTFSFVREQSSYISFYNKRQWVEFDDAPQTYLFGYSGRVAENQGLAIGLFQQNYGVLSTFGGVVNFAHNIMLQEDNNLTFGLNIGFYKSGINKGSVITNYNDPSLDNIPNNSLITINPGINYGTAFLDFGVSVNNLVLYNLKTSQIVKDDPERSIEAHIMHTGYLDTYGFFDKSKFSALLKTDLKKDKTVVSGLVLFAIPSGVWAQAGYNSVYGMSAGIGLNISPKISVEYNFEKGTGNLSNFGASHEIVLAYKFNKKTFYYNDEDEQGSIIPAAKKKKYVPVKEKDSPLLSAKDAQRLRELKEALRIEKEERRQENLKQIAAEAKEKAKADSIAQAKRIADARAQSAALTEAKKAADAKAKAETLIKVKQTAEAKAKADALAKARLAAEEKAKAYALARAKKAAANRARIDSIIRAKLNAEERTKADALAKTKTDTENKAKAEALAAQKAAQEKAKAAALAKAKIDAENKAKAEALATQKAAALAKAKTDAENKAKAEALAAQKAAEEKAKADVLAKAKTDAENKAKAEALAAQKAAEEKAKADALAKAKTDAENKAKAEALAAQKAAEEKAKAAALAKAKTDAENKAKAEALAAQKAAEEKAKADALAKAKTDAENKAKAEALAAQKAAEEKAKAAALAKAKTDAENKAKAEALAAQKAAEEKAKADALAKAKTDAENRAKAEALTAQKAAEEKTKADALAKAKTDAENKAKAEALAAQKAAEEKAKADALAKAKTDAENKAKAEAISTQTTTVPNDENAKAMDDLAKSIEGLRSSQQELLKKFDDMVAVKEKDLKDLKEENDLSEKGIFKAPKPFKSASAENRAIESLRQQITDINLKQNQKIKELEALSAERNKKTSTKNDEFNRLYQNTISKLKTEQSNAVLTNQNLISSLEKINVETEFEKKRRIKRAVFENDQDKFVKDRATLNKIKEETPFSAVPLKPTDFDFGEEQSSMQILKNIKNTQNAYYLILAVHNDTAKRDDFLRKTVSLGQDNIDFFYDVNTSKYFIYYEKFDDLEDAKRALKAKGNKPYTNKLSIVRIENN